MTRENPNVPPPHSASAEHSGPPKKRRGALVWIVVLLVFAAAFYLVLRKNPSQTAGAPGARRGFGTVTLTTATANKGSIGVYLEAIGTVTPVYTASLVAQASGVVTAVHYREGQLVHKGDPLIDIDPRQYQAQVLEAEGALERDTNLLAQAKMDLERYQLAWARNAIPKQTLDDQEKIVLQDEGTVKNDQGTLQYNQVQLGYCHIVAPISGRVGLRLLDPGNVVQSTGGTTMVVVTQVDPITVIFTIPEDHLGEVEQAMHHGGALQVQAFDRALQTKIGTGKLTTTDNQIDTTTGTLKLRATFDNRTGALFPNQFVNTKLLVRTIDNITLVPSNAIQHNGQVAFVYAIENNTARVHNVKTGVSDEGLTVVEGIDSGTIVATSSFEKLLDGAKVNISKTPIPASSSESNTP